MSPGADTVDQTAARIDQTGPVLPTYAAGGADGELREELRACNTDLRIGGDQTNPGSAPSPEQKPFVTVTSVPLLLRITPQETLKE
jgi:hypothetical protein